MADAKQKAFDRCRDDLAEAYVRAEAALGRLDGGEKDALRGVVEALHEVESAACRLRLAVQIRAGEQVTVRPPT